jgi:phi13 family phage major tail protein
MERQSVRIGVDRFFYAPITKDDADGVEYGACVHLPGVNIVALNPKTDIGSFYADDGIFETYVVEGERELQVSFSGVSNKVAAALTGASYDTETGLLVDKSGDSPPYVAVGFRTQKSNGEYRYVWVYKGRFAKSQMTSYTKSNSISPQSDIYTFKAVCRINDGAWRQMLDSEDAILINASLTNAALNNVDTGWFSSPDYAPSAP